MSAYFLKHHQKFYIHFNKDFDSDLNFQEEF